MTVQLTCMYCNHTWVSVFYNKSQIDDAICNNGSCNDSNLIVRDVVDKIDYYKGAPAFPEEDDDNYGNGYI